MTIRQAIVIYDIPESYLKITHQVLTVDQHRIKLYQTSHVIKQTCLERNYEHNYMYYCLFRLLSPIIMLPGEIYGVPLGPLRPSHFRPLGEYAMVRMVKGESAKSEVAKSKDLYCYCYFVFALSPSPFNVFGSLYRLKITLAIKIVRFILSWLL